MDIRGFKTGINIFFKKYFFQQEKETLTEYSYEYASALFMNLSLRNSGKNKCENEKEEVLKVLNDLLEHENL